MAVKGARHGAGGIFKRFFGNKNTVTVLGLLACVAILIFGYNYRVKLAISPFTVPYAKQTIPTRTLITPNMVGNIKIASSYVNSSSTLVKSANDVVGKYVTYKSSIPAGSLFYKSQLMDAEQMPDNVFSNIPDGYTIYSLAVKQEETSYNSIPAGSKIDLYLTSTDKDDEEGNTKKVVFGCLIEKIRVLAVKDSKGNAIIGTGSSNGKPAVLLFAVENSLYELLKAVEIQNEFTIEPVIRNSTYGEGEQGGSTVSSEFLRTKILANMETIE